MGITLRHDAASVLPQNSKSSRKYGQQLVQQRSQQAFAEQTGRTKRAFAEYEIKQRDRQEANRRANNERMIQKQDVLQDIRMDKQQANNIALQKMRMEAAARQDQIAKAQNNLATISDQMIRDKQIPEALVPQLRTLLIGRSAAMSNPNYDEAQRKEFLKGWDAKIGGILSQSRPTPPPLTPEVDPRQEQMLQIQKAEEAKHPFEREGGEKLKSYFMKHAVNEMTTLDGRQPSYQEALSRAIQLHRSEADVYNNPDRNWAPTAPVAPNAGQGVPFTPNSGQAPAAGQQAPATGQQAPAPAAGQTFAPNITWTESNIKDSRDLKNLGNLKRRTPLLSPAAQQQVKIYVESKDPTARKQAVQKLYRSGIDIQQLMKD